MLKRGKELDTDNMKVDVVKGERRGTLLEVYNVRRKFSCGMEPNLTRTAQKNRLSIHLPLKCIAKV